MTQEEASIECAARRAAEPDKLFATKETDSGDWVVLRVDAPSRPDAELGYDRPEPSPRPPEAPRISILGGTNGYY